MIVRDIRHTPHQTPLAAAGDEALASTVWQLPQLPASTSLSFVVAPDFLNYARLLSTGQARAMLALAGGVSSVTKAALNVAPLILANPRRAVAQDFWLIAEALTRYDFALLPRGRATVSCLHSYLTDFALVFDRADFVQRFAELARKRGPWGLWTQQPALALSACARWGVAPDYLVVLLSSHAQDALDALRLARESKHFGRTKILTDLTNFPQSVQRDPRACVADPGLFDGFVIARSTAE